MSAPLGVYVSIPFCKAKCTFCNFASEAFPPSRMQAYVEHVANEFGRASAFAAKLGCEPFGAVDTVYFGGGTPSLLLPEQFVELMQVLRRPFEITADAEITMEAAPGQIGDALLAEAMRTGVNRISLGVQSFVDREAKAVGRLHTGASCREELRRLRQAGVARLSLDLIAGLPHQTAASWAESLEEAVESGVEHVSVYMLETDGESRLGTEVERLRVASQMTVLGQEARYHAAAVPTDEQCVDLYTQACEVLAANGFEQYEISSFARQSGRSRHNLKYWNREPYLGFGLDAHSMLCLRNGKAVRFRNGDELDAYMQASEPSEVIAVDAYAAFEESVFLGLRKSEGIRLSELQRWQQPELLHGMLERARALASEGLVAIGDDFLTLTAKGRVLSSAVFGELLTVTV